VSEPIYTRQGASPGFKGRRAVVTGASQGLGYAIARVLANEGSDVLLLDVNEDAGRKAAANCGAAGVRAEFHACDVADDAAVAAAAARAGELWDGVDYLVNNAGIYPRTATCEMAEADWQRVLGINLGGAFHCVKHFVPLMRGRPGAAIVNISSGRGLEGAPRGAAYSSSKAGLLGLTRSLALEFAPAGIRVNALVPGLTDTAQPRQERGDAELKLAGQKIPLGRIGEPIDIARGVAFLLSDEAAYMTGQALVINGGSVMR